VFEPILSSHDRPAIQNANVMSSVVISVHCFWYASWKACTATLCCRWLWKVQIAPRGMHESWVINRLIARFVGHEHWLLHLRCWPEHSILKPLYV
jgi:hypothetical protein